MSINFVKQDLTTSDANYICHQVNCMGKMNSGVAKAIREKWPIVFENYMEKWLWGAKFNKELLLSSIQIVPLYDNYDEIEHKQYVINMFSQFNYGYDGIRYTRYDDFYTCLEKIDRFVPKGSTLAFPYRIGCDRGGGDWNVIFSMIMSVLSSNYDIKFYYLKEDTWLQKFLKEETYE